MDNAGLKQHKKRVPATPAPRLSPSGPNIQKYDPRGARADPLITPSAWLRLCHSAGHDQQILVDHLPSSGEGAFV